MRITYGLKKFTLMNFMQKINKFFEYGDKNPEYLVVFLHGYGSSGNDLISLAPDLSSSLKKKAYFISPNAPMDLPIPFGPAYQWFELGSGNPKIMYPQIIQSNNILDEFIAQQLKRFNLKYENLILAGFSQGAMMAMYNSTRATNKIKGVIAFSGRFISPEDLGEKINSRPEICLIHGHEDEIVPFEHFVDAREIFTEMDFKFEAHDIKNMGHAINFAALKKAKEFLLKIS
jgi:phospholipase/carboxylesterase